MTSTGRILGIGPTDNTSDQRTPRQALKLIPDQARESFVPYLSVLPGLRDGEDDMTRIAPGRPRAAGVAIEISGKVMDQTGRAVPHALLEIWNANTYGRYTHIEDHSTIQLDPNFLGLGRARCDADGNYRFWTISPGAYLARPDINRWRPKHIHISLTGGACRLLTQMYFPNAEHNDTDPMRILMGDAFENNLGQLYDTPNQDTEEGYRFDLVVGGPSATFFEQ